ncbi:MAG: hypothetical protein C0594_00750 [Marinilabiliales bacterium]|nr:MAG: hypothetical protein C0594_00750 [Marinilabiliales bacterium]
MKRAIKKGTQKLFLKLGYDVHFYATRDVFKLSNAETDKINAITKKIDKIHYGSFHTLFDGWINTDWNLKTKLDTEPYVIALDLTKKHPFRDDTFNYAYSEDFIEHLEQADQIIFLSEVFRTLKPNGVFRMSYPGFEELLKNHFHKIEYENLMFEKSRTYDLYGHRHHFTKEELKLLCKHIGFSVVEFVSFGTSNHNIFKNIDTRIEQANQNTFVELKK